MKTTDSEPPAERSPFEKFAEFSRRIVSVPKAAVAKGVKRAKIKRKLKHK